MPPRHRRGGGGAERGLSVHDVLGLAEVLATSLAAGACFMRATSGSSSPDAEANSMSTVARVAKLHARPKAPAAARALVESHRGREKDLMVVPCKRDVRRLDESSAKAIPCDCRRHGAWSRVVTCVGSATDDGGGGLTRSRPEMERGPEPVGVRASWSRWLEGSGCLGRSAGTLFRTVLQRRARQLGGNGIAPYHAGRSRVGGGESAVHVGTSSALH
jgi:hypothetical protein